MAVKFVAKGRGTTPELALQDARRQAEERADATLDAVDVGPFECWLIGTPKGGKAVVRNWDVEVTFQ